MKFGKLKEGRFAVGGGKPINLGGGEIVTIVDEEIHPVFGQMYRVSEYPGDWFEENCFETIAKTKDIKKEAIKVKLLIEIKRALQEQGEQNIYTNMRAIEPIMDKFFEDHLIQSKAKIWD